MYWASFHKHDTSKGNNVTIQTCRKLDGVGPIDNRPSPNKLHYFVKKKKWHVTQDKWHMTHDMWYMVGGECSLKISAPQLLWFGITVPWIYFHKQWLSGRLNQLINHRGDCRTAPATPFLLIIFLEIYSTHLAVDWLQCGLAPK